jgi:hypothetical protein
LTLGRRLTSLGLAFVGADLLLLLVTGERSLLAAPAGWGFALRLATFGALLFVRLRLLAPPERRLSGARLVLAGLLLATLAQFQLAGARLSGIDAVSYYVFLRSMAKDVDFELTNEYAHYGMLERPDLSLPTSTGHRRSIYSVGPAVAWMPFFFAGEAVARAERLAGAEVDLSGYGPRHLNAVALGSVLYGFLAMLLIHDLLRRHFGEPAALAATLLLWTATFFHWYLVVQPLYSHSTSTCAAAAGIWLWERWRGRATGLQLFLLGVVLGLAMCIRWQNGVLLVLPGLDLVSRLRRERLLPLAGGGLLLAAGAFAGAFPQMAAWKALYDEWVLRYPPHGADFLRLGHPWILETLFSSRHGVLSWTPVLWLGYLGFLPLLRRRAALALPLALPLVLMTWVNMCSGDWWAGGSYSNRRFDSLLPILGLGMAAALAGLARTLRRQPALVLAGVALPFLAWSLPLAEQRRRGLLPADTGVAFGALARDSAQLVSDTAGFPTTWPASWIFALRHGLPASRYDRLVGKYLFYRQSSLGERIEIGATGDDLLLAEGWGPIEEAKGDRVRRVSARARLLAPLDVPETLAVRFRLAAAGAAPVGVVLRVNGAEAARFEATAGFEEREALVPARFWRRELNDVEIACGGALLIDWARIARPGKGGS